MFFLSLCFRSSLVLLLDLRLLCLFNSYVSFSSSCLQGADVPRSRLLRLLSFSSRRLGLDSCDMDLLRCFDSDAEFFSFCFAFSLLLRREEEVLYEDCSGLSWCLDLFSWFTL